jgi:hypothetical protein
MNGLEVLERTKYDEALELRLNFLASDAVKFATVCCITDWKRGLPVRLRS